MMTDLLNNQPEFSAGALQEPIFKGSSMEFRRSASIAELQKLVEASGCQQRGTEEVCRKCGALALDVPMCRQVSDTITANE